MSLRWASQRLQTVQLKTEATGPQSSKQASLLRLAWPLMPRVCTEVAGCGPGRALSKADLRN